MASVNKVILIGHLGRDPEVRNTQDGMKIVNISLATSESWNDKHSGQRQERTEWHRVVVLNEHLAGIAEQYLKKGSRIYVEGSLATRKWTDQSGVEKYTTEIILGRFKSTLTIYLLNKIRCSKRLLIKNFISNLSCKIQPLFCKFKTPNFHLLLRNTDGLPVF